MKVLVIAPHMDDEVLGVGGTILKHVRDGDTVTVVIVSDRIYLHHKDDELLKIEKSCLNDAKKVLGYKDVHFLGFPDERLDSNVQDLLIPLEDIYSKFCPDIVYSCYNEDNNQDHRAVFHAVRVLVRQAQLHPPAAFFLYETPSSTEQSPPIAGASFSPNYFVNIQDVLEDKLNALKCYKKEQREYPHPRSLKGVRTYAQFRGIQSGFEYAEAFMIMHMNWK